MLFAYEAITKAGRPISGKASAATVLALRQDLEKMGMTLVDARFDLLGAAAVALKPRQLPRAVLIDMFGYLRGLLGMGMDMINAWNSVADALPSRLAKETIAAVTASIQQGYPLTEAMERTGLFPPLVQGNIRAGERSGSLEKVFESLEIHYRNEAALVQQVMKATLYPAISVGVLFLVGVGLLAGVVPQLKEIFPPDPPWPTKILLFLSNSVVGYWYFVPLVIASIWFTWWRLSAAAKARVWELFYRIPLIGGVIKQVALTNVFQTLALMLDAGVTLGLALDTTIHSSTSRAIRSRLERSRDTILRGGSFSESFADPFFPSMTAGVLRQGEITGQLSMYLKRLATFLGDRSQARLTTLATLMEPLLLLVGGGMLMLLAVGIFLPIYGQMQHVGGAH